jgi:hypothetical protein
LKSHPPDNIDPAAFTPNTQASTSFGLHSQASYTESSRQIEMTASNHLDKALGWLSLFMDDLGLAFYGPIPVTEDNDATHIIIAHTRKLTSNARHIALKTICLL